jgi:hypothetical protein
MILISPPNNQEIIPMNDDDLDGVLFRFWIRAASYPGGWPSALAVALRTCTTVEEYRAALICFARDKGVNLPIQGEAEAGDCPRYRTALADAIRRPLGVIPASAEGLVTDAEIDAAEKRTRARD